MLVILCLNQKKKWYSVTGPVPADPGTFCEALAKLILSIPKNSEPARLKDTSDSEEDKSETDEA